MLNITKKYYKIKDAKGEERIKHIQRIQEIPL